MFRLPHTPIVFACWIALWALVALFVRAACLTATRGWRRRRFTECVRIIPRQTQTTTPASGPHWTRDPSPTPRKTKEPSA